ncbi:hypothetical protein NM688_g1627 [Phlebia brevispora]|uniref:Uncharacterized protein n=1 Tax=Phlebia brevispora TaxID=194682 RepID=A0ACC1TB63_9APHY|nr:hypothetical protein NM688_g1627 [Phlebia brevispora]
MSSAQNGAFRETRFHPYNPEARKGASTSTQDGGSGAAASDGSSEPQEGEIERAAAIKSYKVKAAQMNTLKPTRTVPVPGRPRAKYKFYKEADVKTLVPPTGGTEATSQQTRQTPRMSAGKSAPRARASGSRATYDDYEDDYLEPDGYFDGMDPEEAEYESWTPLADDPTAHCHEFVHSNLRNTECIWSVSLVFQPLAQEPGFSSMPPVRNRRGMSRKDWIQAYGELRDEREAQQLTASRGRWIYRSQAVARYKEFIAPRDLDSILPIHREENSHGGVDDIFLYNLRDVRDLVERLRPKFSPEKLTSRNGPDILLSDAEREFGLRPCQLKRIKPVRRVPNRRRDARSQWIMVYNRKDVEELKARIEAAAASPTGVPISEHKNECENENEGGEQQ